MMTICMYVLTNYVPAVAVIHKRLALFIVNRFKGYPDGKISKNVATILLEFYARRWKREGEIKFYDSLTTGKGESDLLCKN
jgi:hypothetical protein